MAAFSELDREMIKEKQRAGIKLAKNKGVYRGRLKKYTDKHPGVSQATLYRKLKELD